MEKPTLPTLWTIQLVHTDLSRFDAYLREEMAVMMHASLSTRHEDQAMTTVWDTTNPHLYYYEWHLVSRERWPDVVWGVDKRPKLVIGWLTASDYVAGKLTVECGCTEQVKPIFNLLLDGIVTTFDSTDGRQQKQIIDVTIVPAQQIALQLPTIDVETVPGELGRLKPIYQETLQLIVDGLTETQIAKYLGMTPKTIQSRKRRLMDELGIEGEATATKLRLRGIELGLKARPEILKRFFSSSGEEKNSSSFHPGKA